MFGSRPLTLRHLHGSAIIVLHEKTKPIKFRTVVLALPLLASLLTMSSVKSSDVAQHYFDAQHYSVSERIRGVLDHHIQSTVSCKGVPDGQHADSIIVGPYSWFHISSFILFAFCVVGVNSSESSVMRWMGESWKVSELMST